MELSAFIQDLITSGEVSITGSIKSFSENDIDAAAELLQQLYRDAAMDCPAPVPAYNAATAIAAAKFLYIAVQLTVLREEGEDSIRQHLRLPVAENANDIFSADLMLQYLPQLFSLAEGLAPSDLLVAKLRQTAEEWPLSSIGIKLENPANLDLLLNHSALKQLYVDRIIQHKDKSRTSPQEIKESILSTTGEYSTKFWPDFDNS